MDCTGLRDNGMGIGRENFERIFGMFVRLHGDAIPGTGIGLALCRKVVEQSGDDGCYAIAEFGTLDGEACSCS